MSAELVPLTQPVRIRQVTPLDGFVVRLVFSDGTSRSVDLDTLVRGPIFQPLRDDPQLFRSVRVDHQLGTIVWPNGADLDPDVLRYELTSVESNEQPAQEKASPQVAHLA